jgi:glycerophosphoryl diester phosphodiesterase
VLEAPYPSWITPTSTVEQVRQAGGCAYVFLSAVPFVRALDTADGSPEQKALFKILERGVDGVITDRPQRVRQLLDVWRGARSFAAKA